MHPIPSNFISRFAQNPNITTYTCGQKGSSTIILFFGMFKAPIIFIFIVVGQSNWLLANFGCPISSPNPRLPLSLQLTNRTQQTGTINNDPILDCKQFWDLNDIIREHEGEPNFGNLWVHIG
jgi:hypothetical protein